MNSSPSPSRTSHQWYILILLTYYLLISWMILPSNTSSSDKLQTDSSNHIIKLSNNFKCALAKDFNWSLYLNYWIPKMRLASGPLITKAILSELITVVDIRNTKKLLINFQYFILFKSYLNLSSFWIFFIFY